MYKKVFLFYSVRLSQNFLLLSVTIIQPYRPKPSVPRHLLQLLVHYTQSEFTHVSDHTDCACVSTREKQRAESGRGENLYFY